MLAKLDRPGAFWKRTDQTFPAGVLSRTGTACRCFTTCCNMSGSTCRNCGTGSRSPSCTTSMKSRGKRTIRKRTGCEPLIDLWQAFHNGRRHPRYRQPGKSGARHDGRSTLVSGGTGFVGRFIVENLLAAGHACHRHGAHAAGGGFFSEPVRFVEGPLEPDHDHVRCICVASISSFTPHSLTCRGNIAAGRATTRRRSGVSNLDGSIALFEAARAAKRQAGGFPVEPRRLWRPACRRMLTEETAPCPDTLYGEVKLATEQYLSGMSGLPASAARVCA